MVCVCVVLICLGLALTVRAVPVTSSEEWGMTLQPGESFTCIAHFIPDVPGIPDTLLFEQAPDWTGTYPFNWAGEGWATAISGDNRIAYLHGPRITNDVSSPIDVFSFNLFYEWDDEDENYDPDWPIYQEVVIFDDQDIIYDFGWRGTPGNGWDGPYGDTWREKAYPGSDPYENPVPGPATIGLLGLGAALLRRRR